jgi:hypothetical protein
MGRRVECAADSLDDFGFDFLIATGAVSHNEIAGASRDLDAVYGRPFLRYSCSSS